MQRSHSKWGAIAGGVLMVAIQEDGQGPEDKGLFVAVRDRVAPVFNYRVVAQHPHDPNAFTQGLTIGPGGLYEGTGLEGRSSLRRVDLATGKVLQSRSISRQFFGEGITILEDRIYQLTWLSGVCFMYDLETFAHRDAFTYRTQGWGLTTDGQYLIMGDGSSRIIFREPTTFAKVGFIDVHDGDTPVPLLNELEYIKGEIWANVWPTDFIARINPANGLVTSWLDLSGLLRAADPRSEGADVLNGIAYDGGSDRTFVTGKLWPTLFEIELIPPS